jgi:hypothetical protein
MSEPQNLLRCQADIGIPECADIQERLKTAHAGSRCQHFSDTLRLLAGAVTSERLKLSTIAQFMGRRSVGALLLILALPMVVPIPAVGTSVLFGIPLILISAQLSLARRQVWLPKRLANVSIKRSDFAAFVDAALPMLRRAEWLVRPRVLWMTDNWVMVPVSVVCMALSIIIALPIPLGHMLPGLAICVFALGILERDGLAIAPGLMTSMIALTVVRVTTHSIANWLTS